MEQKKNYKVEIKLKPFYYDSIPAKNEEKALEEAYSLIESRYHWAEIENIKASEMKSTSLNNEKKYKVDIELASFNYDHIYEATEDEAIEEAASLINERYPWAIIENIKAIEI